MVVWLTGMLYLHIILVVQRSLTVPRPSQAFHHIICERRILFAIFPTVTYRTCTEAASRRGVPDGLSLQRYTQVMKYTRYLSIYMLIRYQHWIPSKRYRRHWIPPIKVPRTLNTAQKVPTFLFVFVLRSLFFWFFGFVFGRTALSTCGQSYAAAPTHTPAPTPAHTTLSVVQQNNERFRGESQCY